MRVNTDIISRLLVVSACSTENFSTKKDEKMRENADSVDTNVVVFAVQKEKICENIR